MTAEHIYTFKYQNAKICTFIRSLVIITQLDDYYFFCTRLINVATMINLPKSK